MKPFRILVDLSDIDGFQSSTSLWDALESQELALIRHIHQCYFPGLSTLYYVVEFEFHGAREFNVFKLKHPNEHFLLMKKNELYERSKSRLLTITMNKDIFI